MAEFNEKEKNQVSEAELEEVSGGYNPAGGMIPFQRYKCQVTGYYWGNTFQSVGPYNAVIGQVMQVYYNNGAQGPCKYVLENGGVAIGWTVWNNFALLPY